MNVFSTKQARSHKNFESFNTAAEWRGPDRKDGDRTTGAQAIFSPIGCLNLPLNRDGTRNRQKLLKKFLSPSFLGSGPGFT